MKKTGFLIYSLIFLISSCSFFTPNSASTSDSDLSLSEDSTLSSEESSTSSVSETSQSSEVSEISIFNSEDSSSSISSEENEYGLMPSIQEGTILHAWGWKMNVIASHLEEIAEAGFTSIQTSPMQPQKDYYDGGSWSGQWWKLYQPLGLTIATKNNALGTKDDLATLCQEAEKYNIKIVMDIVANHLGGGNETTFNSGVQEYESEIYTKKLLHEGYGYANDGNVSSIVRGNIGGFPDLQTENPIVENRVISMLKEYIDVGVDGFRFDAAKHIETPSDDPYSSSFWPDVTTQLINYAKEKELDIPYFYGEILNTPGNGRSFSYYTPYMSITDNVYGNNIRSGVKNKNANDASNKNYNTNQNANKLVLWAESHDTYANSEHESTYVSQSDIDKAYAIVSSRKDASALYFARPNENGIFGDLGTLAWQSKTVSEINKFHNYFSSANESFYSNSGLVINERYKDESGVLIVNVNGSNQVTNLKVNNIPDGSYIDQISGNSFSVIGGQLSGTIGSSGIAVVYNKTLSNKPSITISNTGGYFANNIDLSLSISGATSSYYKINNGSQVNFNGTISFTLGSSFADFEEIMLTIYASNGVSEVSKEYRYKKLVVNENQIAMINLEDSISSDNKVIYAWIWKQAKPGRYIKVDRKNDVLYITKESDDYAFLLANFVSNNAPSVGATTWLSPISKTADIKIESNLVDISSWR